MDERDRFPAPPSPDEPMGGLTGATGNLTPDDPDDAFVPAETREMTDAGAARDLTAAAHRRRESRTAGAPDDPGSLRAREERTAPNDRDGGYGSEHGLAADDPAYREEEHLPPRRPEARPGANAGSDSGATRLGGDESRSPEEEHL
jgi:hypothetical protein